MILSGKVVLLTGASGGIGGAIASELASRGASIIAVGRQRTRLDLLCDRLRNNRSDLIPIAADVADPKQLQGLLDTIIERAPRVDVLINCAGVQRFGFFAKEQSDDVGAMFAVNATAPIALARAFVPQMVQRGTGRVVNIGSIAGSIGMPCFVSYSASKFALRGFSEALRRELAGTGVGVTYVAPRYTRTAFNRLEVVRMAYALKVHQDEPQAVAAQVIRAIESDSDTSYFGWRERLLIRLNSFLPDLVDRRLRRRAEHMRPFAVMALDKRARSS